MNRLHWSIAYSALSFLLCQAPACALDEPPVASEEIVYTLADVATELELSRLLAVEPVSSLEEDGITDFAYDPAAPARCFNGSPYRVSIRRGESANVLLYLQGGGACWDKETCFDHPFAREYAEKFTETSETAGVFSRDPKNPFRDWNVVYAPYCDGSLWMGNADPDYGGRTAYHRGMANVAAAVGLLKREFPAPGKLVVSGSSAGGFGTLMGYVVSRTALPKTKLYVLNDSGPWRVNEEHEALLVGTANWNLWNTAAFRPPACLTCNFEYYRIADWAMRQDPDTRWAIIAFNRDVVIADIYMRFGRDYTRVLGEALGYLESRNAGQFGAYVIDGSDHTRIASDLLYEVEEDGQELSAWIDALVNDGADWQSVGKDALEPN